MFYLNNLTYYIFQGLSSSSWKRIKKLNILRAFKILQNINKLMEQGVFPKEIQNVAKTIDYFIQNEESHREFAPTHLDMEGKIINVLVLGLSPEQVIKIIQNRRHEWQVAALRKGIKFEDAIQLDNEHSLKFYESESNDIDKAIKVNNEWQLAALRKGIRFEDAIQLNNEHSLKFYESESNIEQAAQIENYFVFFKKMYFSPLQVLFDSAQHQIDTLGPVHLTYFSRFEGISSSGVRLDRPDKWIYVDQYNDKKQWMIDFSFKPPAFCYKDNFIARYISSGLYRLVLKDAAPEEKLVITSPDHVHLGSKFIDGFEPLATIYTENEFYCSDPIYLQKNTILPILCRNNLELGGESLYEEVISEAENGWLVLVSMILLGENDAHGKNTGIIRLDNGRFKFAKIDHDSSDGMYISNNLVDSFKKASFSLTRNSNFRIKELYSKALRHKKDVISALKHIRDEIPDQAWATVINDRIENYHHVNYPDKEMIDSCYSDVVEKFMKIKTSLPGIIEGLEMENL